MRDDFLAEFSERYVMAMTMKDSDSKLTPQQQARFRMLHIDAQAYAAKFSQVLEALRGSSVPYQWAPGDCVRLLTLRTWTLRYKVTLDYVVRTLVKYWDKRVRKPKSSSSLGVRVATLVSEHSRQILEESVLRDFPNHENEQAWKCRKRSRILSASCYLSDAPACYAFAYRNYIEERRTEIHRVTRQLSARAFRDNPFAR
jgi:hypothetical protein